MEERLQKILARCGFGSRRDCEVIIQQGRVTVNGLTATIGSKADPNKDQIKVDGSSLQYTEPEKVYIALYKPRFVLSDRPADDPRQTVFSLVPNSDDLFVVGRLDFESEGLVLLTNDGDLSNKLSHPRYGKEKEYHVLFAKRPDEDQLGKWRRGVVLEDGVKTAPADVRILRFQGEGAWVSITMHEGRKREIREIGKMIGLPIVKLVRVRIGTLRLGNLKPKEWVFLKDSEVKELRDLVSKKPSSNEKGRAPQKIFHGKDEKKRRIPSERSRSSEKKDKPFPSRPPFRTDGGKKRTGKPQ